MDKLTGAMAKLHREIDYLLWLVHIVFPELIIDPVCSIIFEAGKEQKDI